MASEVAHLSLKTNLSPEGQLKILSPFQLLHTLKVQETAKEQKKDEGIPLAKMVHCFCNQLQRL